MFDPVTIIAGISAVVSAAGSIKAGKDQKAAAEYNAQVDEQNAIAATNKAAYDESIHRDKVKRLLSEQKAIIGASGVDISGSPLLATIDTIEKGELDALAIRYGGEVESQQYTSSATASRLEGQAASTASKYKAGSTLLSGASKSYSTYKGI